LDVDQRGMSFHIQGVAMPRQVKVRKTQEEKQEGKAVLSLAAEERHAKTYSNHKQRKPKIHPKPYNRVQPFVECRGQKWEVIFDGNHLEIIGRQQTLDILPGR